MKRFTRQRGATLVEKNKEYVQAARIIGLPGWLIMLRHILPNLMHIVLISIVLDFSGLVLNSTSYAKPNTAITSCT